MHLKTRICGVPEHFNLPWELAIEELSGSGQDITWTAVPQGSDAMADGLKQGTYDVAVMLTSSTVKAIYGGLDATVIGTHVPSPLRWGIHVGAQSDIQGVQDMQGRTYAISRIGSGSHLVAMLDARARGWATDDMMFQTVGTLDGGRKALVEGTADIFFWEQFMTKPLVDAGQLRRIDVREPPWASFVVVARTQWLDGASDDVLRELLATVDTHAQRLSADPEATAVVLDDRFEISKADGLRWMELTDWRCSSNVSVEGLDAARRELASIFPEGGFDSALQMTRTPGA